MVVIYSMERGCVLIERFRSYKWSNIQPDSLYQMLPGRNNLLTVCHMLSRHTDGFYSLEEGQSITHSSPFSLLSSFLAGLTVV